MREAAGRAWARGAALREVALVCVALVVTAFAFLYLPLGLAAVASHDGLGPSIRTGLGIDAPLPQRLHAAVSALPWLWPALILTGAAHVGLRRLLRRQLAVGDSLEWDALASPAVTAALAAAAAALVEARRHGIGANVVVRSGMLVGIGTLALLALAGLGLALVLRHPRLRTALVALLVAAVCARLGAEAWGRSALARFRAQHAAEWAALDARRAARERPVLRGVALDEDAWPRYRRLIDSVGSGLGEPGPLGPLTGLGELGPFDPVPDVARAALAARRAEVAAFREAVRCRRSVPELAADPFTPVPSLLGLRSLAILAALEANERAAAGGLEEAALVYLELVRAGGDIGGGSVIHALVGSTLEERGLRALGQLVRSGRLDERALAGLERDRATLEQARVSIAEALETEGRRLGTLDELVERWQAAVGEPLVLPAVVPYRALAAHAQRVAYPLQAEFHAALARDDLDAARRAAARSADVAGRSRNPLLRLAMGESGFEREGGDSLRLFHVARQTLARFRLLEGALALERARLARGRYPEDSAAVALPKDPFAPAEPLRYRLEASGYQLWSVGRDGVDDGGKAGQQADVVL